MTPVPPVPLFLCLASSRQPRWTRQESMRRTLRSLSPPLPLLLLRPLVGVVALGPRRTQYTSLVARMSRLPLFLLFLAPAERYLPASESRHSDYPQPACCLLDSNCLILTTDCFPHSMSCSSAASTSWFPVIPFIPNLLAAFLLQTKFTWVAWLRTTVCLLHLLSSSSATSTS